ncbi:uncharacterized protein B0H64DRAFT_390067 [Chaetomium fimeti]|uniref:Fungal N-terminal domain-containing protein n=1 Tax=Chaetomium fimeti TaxID=1854472 RepID=A0AAE0LT87_9PEZI|nr:hypothetical protein B0H64DRAFT_390067 [Chaetomium fimeti]
MEAAGTALAVASLVGKTVFAIADISSGYKSAYPELARVENNLVSIREVLDRLPRDGHSVFDNVLNDLAKNVRDIQGFVDKRVRKAGARSLLVKLGWHGDRVKLERMEAALETSKSTLMIAIQACQLASKDADRKELVAGLKLSMQETIRKVSGYEFGSARIQDIRAHLDSVSRSLQERRRGSGAAGTVAELDMGKPLTTWPTFEAWLDSFAPSQDDVERDEKALAEGQGRQAEQGGGVDTEFNVANGTHGQERDPNLEQRLVKVCIVGLEGAACSMARIMTLSPQTEIAEVLETLHREAQRG